MKEANKKKEEKIKELQEFISRFSANASKSKQATSRKRALEKIQLDDMRPSSRKYPYIDFRPNREIGNEVLMVENLSKTIDGVKVLDNISFTLGHDDKVAFVGANEQAITTLFKILVGEMEPDEGNYKWGVTTSQAYFPKDNTAEFDNDLTITDWLTQYSEIKDATYVRGFLGRMLFPGEDGIKRVRVLSGGEKVRCLLSKMMISGANILILDEPTNHLDMESITALNNGLIKFPGVILFTSHDHQFVQTTANRIMEILPNGTMIDKITTYDLLTLLFSFPLPIILALCLNEVRNQKAKKFVQTASYIPYFISWVIAANIFLTFLSFIILHHNITGEIVGESYIVSLQEIVLNIIH